MNAANTDHNANPMSALIAAALKDEAASLNRSAAMIELMFSQEATYSMDSIAAVIRLKGNEKTEKVDAALADLSPEFVAIVAKQSAIKDAKPKDRSEAEKNMLEVFHKQLRAARIMYERAMTAVYGLRHHKAMEVVASKRKTGSLAVEYLKGEVDGKIKTTDKEMSCSQLITAGNAALEETAVKTKRAAKSSAKNPVTLAEPAKALATMLTTLAASGKRVVPAELDDALETDINNVLRELFVGEFFDGAVFDRATFNDWLKNVQAYAAVRPGNGKPEDKPEASKDDKDTKAA